MVKFKIEYTAGLKVRMCVLELHEKNVKLECVTLSPDQIRLRKHSNRFRFSSSFGCNVYM